MADATLRDSIFVVECNYIIKYLSHKCQGILLKFWFLHGELLKLMSKSCPSALFPLLPFVLVLILFKVILLPYHITPPSPTPPPPPKKKKGGPP